MLGNFVYPFNINLKFLPSTLKIILEKDKPRRISSFNYFYFYCFL